MHEQEFISRLIFELQAAASHYRTEAESVIAPADKSLLEVLGRRCERFEAEISEAINALPGFLVERRALKAESLKTRGITDQRELIFWRIEERENRLERLYREILRSGVVRAKMLGVLREQFRAVSKWHSFVITEEDNFIFGSEVRIPSELNEI